MKKKYSVYVRNADYGPASYYRVIQYLEELPVKSGLIVNNALNNQEFHANLNCTNAVAKKFLQLYLFMRIIARRILALSKDICYNRPQTVIIQREVVPRYLPYFLALMLSILSRHADIIWDFDDDIFESGEISKREMRLLLEISSHIIVVSEYAKFLIPSQFHFKVIVLPTTEKIFLNSDLKKVTKRRREDYGNTVCIVWVGTSGNLKYIDRVLSELDEAAGRLKEAYGKSIVLYIVCNHKYNCDRKPEHIRIKSIPWSRENAKKAILKSHIGIMPLEDTVFAKGKGGFKLIQYMASGIPVVADDVGYNQTVVSEETGYLVGNSWGISWTEAIYMLAGDLERWEQFGRNAYKKYRSDFYFYDNLEVWKKLLDNGPVYRNGNTFGEKKCRK